MVLLTTRPFHSILLSEAADRQHSEMEGLRMGRTGTGTSVLMIVLLRKERITII